MYMIDEKYIGLYIAAVCLELAFRILFCVSISLDAKAKNVKDRKVYSILSFFFPLVVGIVYACIRNKNSQPTAQTVEAQIEGAQSTKSTKSIVCFILAIVMLLASGGIGGYIGYSSADEFFSGAFDDFEGLKVDMYDLKGNLIAEQSEVMESVPLYDREDNQYLFVEGELDEKTYEDTSVYVNQTDKKEYLAENCYVDAEGYFYYDEKGEIEYDVDKDAYLDKQGNAYHQANGTYWDKDGNIKNYFDELFESSNLDGLEDIIE